VPHQIPSKGGPDDEATPNPAGESDGTALLGVLRVGNWKLLAGFPGQSTKSGCLGGCWCPVPDPTTGVERCVAPPSLAATTAVATPAVERQPPGRACAAAMNATGCAEPR
jgi:hypothetical protein